MHNRAKTTPILCQTGQELKGNDCVPKTCPVGQTLQGDNCTCPLTQTLINGVCVMKTCAIGQYLTSDGKCAPIICAETDVLSGNTCVKKTCPIGQVFRNGTCVVPAYTAYQNLGCFKDDNTYRALRKNVIGVTDIEGCASAAKSEGKTLFAIQYGNECWIDTEDKDYTTYGPGDCATRPGFPAGTGNSGILNVYKWN
jgi:hypothetical protein